MAIIDKSVPTTTRRKRKAAVVPTILALAAVLIVAMIDGGKEPLRPIVERVALPVTGEAD